MKINKILTFGLLSTLLALTSCNTNSSLIKSEVKASIEIVSNNKNGQVIEAKDVTVADTLYSIELDTISERHLMPSTGDVKMLVIPMLMPGYTTIDINNDGIDDKDQIVEDLNTAFFGHNDEKVGFASVADYYYQSSFGKLNLSGYVTDWFDVSSAGLGYQHAAEIDLDQTYEVIQKAVDWVKANNFVDLTEYDSDKDGYIDGLWLIYSCPNYANGGPNTEQKNYWAYTTWANKEGVGEIFEEPDVNDPAYQCFGWASYDFMYEEYGSQTLDTHTYIHETGHFMGLNDYYGDSTSYSPIGKVDMMDGNIVDHNSFSKMLLGWTKPTIVTGSATIEISSLINENSFIIIPSDDTVIENNTFNPWDEYIMIELYTNEANNYKDSRQAIANRPLAPSTYGVRIYHIDRRMFYADVRDSYNIILKEYEGEEIGDLQRLLFPIDNTRTANYFNFYLGLDPEYNLFDEIRLIEENKIDTFSTGGFMKDKTMFKEGDQFSVAEYTNFFNNGKLNNGKTHSAVVKIGGIK